MKSVEPEIEIKNTRHTMSRRKKKGISLVSDVVVKFFNKEEVGY